MEPLFHLYSGNAPEQLAEMLAQLLRSNPPQDPFASREVIVQSKGMSSYLNGQLARHLGCVYNIRFPFLNRAAEEILRTALPEHLLRDLDFFRPEVMKFAILKELLALTGDPEQDGALSPFAPYLESVRKEERARQLADVLAVRFEQYQIYRPEMMLHGNLRDPAQKELWRRISAGKIIRPALFQAFFQLRQSPELQKKFPELYLFGIGTLPPLYFHFFRKTAEFLPVHFFYQTPCRGEWSERVGSEPWMTLQDPPEDLPEENLLSGNPLLSSWGKAGRDFFNTILEASDYDPDAPESSFRDPGCGTLLHALQQDILENRSRTEPLPGELLPCSRMTIAQEDASIQLHNCHHPMREVEILHDELLHFFAEDPSRKAGDVLVMAPDIALYEPYIRAVFQHSAGKTIPFSIGDRGDDAEKELQKTFFSLASLFQGRMTLTELLEFFESDAVYPRFGILSDQLPALREMLAESHTTWGIDDAYRSKCLGGEVSFSGGTLEELKDRLLLGMAMDPEEDGAMTPAAGILPMQLASGDRLMLAEAWEQFLTQFCHFARRSAPLRQPEEWHRMLHEVLDQLFLTSGVYLNAVRDLRAALDGVAENALRAGIAIPIALETFLAETEGFLAGQSAMSADGFLRGAVTFCTMRPMRNVPHRMICLLGMSENAYPRRENQTGLDLIWRHPCRGDRSIRTEDRFLFLEALLAARERFRIFYCGQNPQDNTPAPPSTLVSELLQYLEMNYELPKQGKMWLRHRMEMLHNYHPGYFSGGERASYSQSAGKIAAFLAESSRELPAPRFAESELPDAADLQTETDDNTLNKLYRFFCNPFAAYAQEVLQIADPGYAEADPAQEEPFKLDFRGEWDLQKQMYSAALSGDRQEQDLLREKVRLHGLLPVEPFGEWALQRFFRDQEAFFCKSSKTLNHISLREWWRNAEPVTLPRELRHNLFISAAKRENTVALFSSGKYSAKSEVLGRLFQLLRGTEESYLLCCPDHISEFPALSAEEMARGLQTVLQLRAEGRVRPLRFLPETSRQFYLGKDPGKKWYSDFTVSGDWTLFAVRYFCGRNDLEINEEKWHSAANRFFGKEEA